MKYEYKCKECDLTTIIEQSIKEDSVKQCPICQSETFHRVLSPTTTIFKGDGWTTYDKSGRYHE